LASAEGGVTLDEYVAAGGSGCIRLDYGRDALPGLFEARGAQVVAEIGVERGHFSKLLLTGTTFELLCVDPWEAYPGYREHVSQEKLDGFYLETRQHLEPFIGRLLVLRESSVAAAERFPNGTLDAVYIDANHTLPHVIADLAAWVPKVKPGGIVCGHDYGRQSVGHVKQAVEAWVSAYGIDPWFLLTADKSPTWLWVKK
jgi:hypothetical protein